MTWWLEHWTTTPDVLFTFKGNLEIPKIQTSCVKKESSTKQWYSALGPNLITRLLVTFGLTFS